jgi:hypothetical protein
MIIHMSNGMVYTIPKGVKYANISIAISDTQLESAKFDMWYREFTVKFECNKDVLCGYSHVGYETSVREGMQIRLHWFIDKVDLNRCSVKLEDK